LKNAAGHHAELVKGASSAQRQDRAIMDIQDITGIIASDIQERGIANIISGRFRRWPAGKIDTDPVFQEKRRRDLGVGLHPFVATVRYENATVLLPAKPGYVTPVKNLHVS
jgi:hypothetical protein